MKLFVVVAVLLLLVTLSVNAGRVTYQDVPLEGDSDEWLVLRPLQSDEVLRVRLALYRENLQILEQLFWEVSDPSSDNFHEYWTSEGVMSLVSPPKVKQDLVLVWARESGCIDAVSYGDHIDITCQASVLEEMLGDVEIYAVQDVALGEISPKIITGSYSLPTHIANIVRFVQNLAMNVHKRKVNSFGPRAGATRFEPASEDQVVPQTLMNLYNISHIISTDSSQNVAEFSVTGYQDSDLVAFDQGVALPDPNPVTSVGSYSQTPPNVECTLDIQMITSIGQNGTNFYYTVDGWVLDFAQELLKADNPPLVNSISWSADERTEGYAYNSQTDSSWQMLGAIGVSVLAASGDDGAVGTSRCSGNRFEFNPGYPATSPYITSVGATMLVGQPTTSKSIAPVCSEFGHTCAVDGTEDPADENFGGYATGGGFSVYEARPSYQDSVVTEYLNDNTIPKPPSSYYNDTNRGFPDVAANGYSILIYRGGRWETVGGTSASTPIWGGIYALMNDVLLKNNKKPIGFANPLIYQTLFLQDGLFKNIGDLTTNNDDGCQYGYTSNPNGWDPVTGLGVPNVGNILSFIENNLSMFP